MNFLIKKNSIYINKIILLSMSPLLFSLFYMMPFVALYLVTVGYMIIFTIVINASLDVKIKNLYGMLLYERKSNCANKYCDSKCILGGAIYFITLHITMQTLITSGYISILYAILLYVILGSLFIINISFKKLPMKIYSKGLLVQGKMFAWSKFDDATLLKSYSSKYEIRFENKNFKSKTIELNKIEVDFVKKYVC